MPKPVWPGATMEHTHLGSVTGEQQRQTGLGAKTLRATALLPWGFVVPSLQPATGMRRQLRLAQGQNPQSQDPSRFSVRLLEMQFQKPHFKGERLLDIGIKQALGGFQRLKVFHRLFR